MGCVLILLINFTIHKIPLLRGGRTADGVFVIFVMTVGVKDCNKGIFRTAQDDNNFGFF